MFTAPYPPYGLADKTQFGYETVVKRWPIILTSIIDTVYRVDHDAGVALQPGTEASTLAEEKIAEGKEIIEKISKLKYEMARDRPLEPIPDDGEALIDVYNTELARLELENKNTWFAGPWLYIECYLYRLIRSYFKQTTHWKSFDPFFTQKEATFRSSSTAIYRPNHEELASIMHGLEAEKDELLADPDKLLVIFREMIQMCLWGNATDLSLLTHMSHEDIANLQSVGRDAQAARKEYILKDDQEAVLQHFKSLKSKDARVDFVLDNAGFELFTDFIFADFLVTYTPYVSSVVFHPKMIPWFVSDVTPLDFTSTIPNLLSANFFPSLSATPSTASESAAPPLAQPEEYSHLRQMATRWQRYLDEGVFGLSVPLESGLGTSNESADFWTSPWPYWDMKERAPGTFEVLKDSGLVIFKGDLNFRKLTGDVTWPVSTPFETAIGPLSGSFPILSLRTNKADVAVGVPQGVADALDAKGEKWRVDGRYALVSFCPKTA